MGYDEQLSAAKFRAERDIARQECERLRARLRDSVPREAYERKRAAWLRQIRECEAALRKRREHIKRLENAALERRTVREEDREAAERDLARQELYRARRDAENMRVELCSALVIDVDTGWSDAMAELDRRLMPEGYEWPRYESGELVMFGDEFVNAKGNASTLRTIAIEDCRDALGGAVFWKLGKGACAVTLENGERVKRPAPKVLDSEGDFRIIRIEQDGKCAIHDDDADEPCGMTVPSTELTHKRPVIDADGVEIRAKETVFDKNTGEELIVTGFEDGRVWCEHRMTDADALPVRGMWSPDQLTHERPIADTWERLEEDAEKDPCGYFGFDEEEICGKCPASGKSCEQTMAQDLVRRCRALAERGE